jgi:hypothetical protein
LARQAPGTEPTLTSKISIYPNPTSGNITIETATAGTLSIYNIDSKLIGQYRIDVPSGTIELPSDLPTGIYTCKFNREDGVVEVDRLILQR